MVTLNYCLIKCDVMKLRNRAILVQKNGNSATTKTYFCIIMHTYNDSATLKCTVVTKDSKDNILMDYSAAS